MLKVYQTIIEDHDLRFVALAIGICALSTLTGAAIAQYSMNAEIAKRRGWLMLAGLVTGLGMWTTHFTAMLGYRNDLNIQFDLVVASYSLLLAVVLTIAGGLVGLLNRERGLLAGSIVGVGVAIAHFMDMHALRLSGTIVHDHLTSVVAVIVGLALSAYAGHLLVR